MIERRKTPKKRVPVCEATRRVGDAIGRLRTLSEVSRPDLAVKLNITTTYMREIERGAKPIPIDLLQEIATALALPAWAFLIVADYLDKPLEGMTKPIKIPDLALGVLAQILAGERARQRLVEERQQHAVYGKVIAELAAVVD